MNDEMVACCNCNKVQKGIFVDNRYFTGMKCTVCKRRVSGRLWY